MTAWLAGLLIDTRYAARSFARTPVFTVAVVSILALGLGVNISTFSVADALLLRLLPVEDPSTLFRTVPVSADAAAASTTASYDTFRRMQQRTKPLADLMAYSPASEQPVSIGGSEQARVWQQSVSGNYFSVLGVEPLLGRTITARDDAAPGSGPVAVISYGLWNRRFGGKRSGVLGRTLRWNNRSFQIIGVAPLRFFGVEVGKRVDLWTPISMAPPAILGNDHAFWLEPMGRLKPGVTIAAAVAPMQAVRHEFMLEDVRQHAPPGTPRAVIQRFLAGTRIKGVPAGGGVSSLRREYRQPLEIMMYLVSLVLLIACTNVANLLIARGSARRQEIAIRLSLGAARTRVLRQLITESLLLAAAATLCGLLIAHWAVPLLTRFLTPSAEPARLATGIDLRLLAFTLLLGGLTLLVCGVLPAFRLSGTSVDRAFQSGARLTGASRGGTRKLLAAFQVSLSFVLVIGGLLFIRTLLNLLSSGLGFRPNHVLVTRVTLRQASNETDSVYAWQDLLRRTRHLPGVQAASLASAGLFSGNPGLMGLRTNGSPGEPARPDCRRSLYLNRLLRNSGHSSNTRPRFRYRATTTYPRRPPPS